MARVSGRRVADKEKGFIWLPREKGLTYTVYIDSVDETNNYFTAEFTRAICPEIGSFKMEMINASGEYTDKYSSGTVVQFYLDLDGSGPTKRFEGKIDTIENKFDQSRGWVLNLEGGHVSSNSLLNIHVTKEYTGNKTIQEILEELFTDYLTGYTVNYLSTNTDKPTIKWEDKPINDCIYDLSKLADADTYVNDSLVLQFFDKKSIHNSGEAIVWNDTMLSTEGLGLQSLDTRNYVRVVGDDGAGLPVLYTSEDAASQASYDKKEEIIADTKVTTENYAQQFADVNLALKKIPELEGKATALILPSLSPGETIWISDPVMKILDKYQISKYTHKLPIQQTICTIYKKKTLPGLFKDRIAKELALTEVKNPYQMEFSLNLKFDSEDELSSKDANLSLSDGKLIVSSGAEGTATTPSFVQSKDINQIHLKVVGIKYESSLFKISTDGGDVFQNITPGELVNLNTPGANIVLQIKIQSADTELDSVALLMKGD